MSDHLKTFADLRKLVANENKSITIKLLEKICEDISNNINNKGDEHVGRDKET